MADASGERDDKFTIREGDLRLDDAGAPNPYGYSFRVVDGVTHYYGEDGRAVDPALPPDQQRK